MISVLSFSKTGEEIAQLILNQYEEAVLYKSSEFRIRDKMEGIWNNSDTIIFISATGIAVRYIAPYIVHKSTDPAVIVIDDIGRYVISLLSGHLGGANDMAIEISKHIDGSIPIITTASDSRGFESPDLYAKRRNYKILNAENLTAVSSAMVNGKQVALYSEIEPDMDYKNITLINKEDLLKRSADTVVAISSEVLDLSKISLQIIPKNLYLGIGCRRGVPSKDIIDLIEEVFEQYGLYTDAIAGISSIELKSDETGILETAEHYNVVPKFYSVKELKTVEEKFKSSEFVKKITGVGAVAEPSAFLSCGELIIERVAKNDVTLAIGREKRLKKKE